MTAGRWVQHPITLELIPRDEYVRPKTGKLSVHVVPEYVSPVTGERIGSRDKLKAHEQEHNIRHLSEYGDNDGRDWFEKKARERKQALMGTTTQARKERVNDLLRVLDQKGVRR